MGPPSWWELSPALTMRLRLLASFSGGGLAWRAGDHRWLAGEGRVWCGIGALHAGCRIFGEGGRGPGDHRERESGFRSLVQIFLWHIPTACCDWANPGCTAQLATNKLRPVPRMPVYLGIRARKVLGKRSRL